MKRAKGLATTGIMVRLPKDIKASLDEEATNDERTTANLIRKILKEYVEQKEHE